MDATDRSPEVADAILIARAEIDPEGFGTVCARHALALESWLIRQSANPHVAADLVAETFAQAWQSRKRFRAPDDGSAAPWLFGIARNLLRRSLRTQIIETRARRRLGMSVAAPVAEETEAALDRIAAERQQVRLAPTLAGMPERERAAVTMHIIDERSYQDVASELGCSPAAARTYVSRGLRRLTVALRGDKL